MIKIIKLGDQEFKLRPLRRGERKQLEDSELPFHKSADRMLEFLFPDPADQERLDQLEQPDVTLLAKEVVGLTFSTPSMEKNSLTPGHGLESQAGRDTASSAAEAPENA